MPKKLVDSTVDSSFNPGGALIPLLGRYEPLHEARYRFAVPFLRNRQFIDFGCGFGFGASILSAHSFGRGIGVDVDPRCIRFATRRFSSPRLSFRLLRHMELPAAEGSVGLVTAFEVIEHLTVDHFHAFLREAVRVLSEDGVIIGSTPNAGCGLTEDPVFHLCEFDQTALQHVAAQYGLHSTILGVETSKLPSNWVSTAIATRVPRVLKRSYSLKVLQSLLAATQYRKELGLHIQNGIGTVNPSQCSDLIFLYRKSRDPELVDVPSATADNASHEA